MSDKVRGVTLTKKASLLGRRGEVQARGPIHQVKFSLGSSSQRDFSSANFYMFGKSFGEVGLSQLLCIDWLLAWNVMLSEAGLSLTHLRSGHLGVHFQGSFALYLKQSLAVQPPRAPQIT